MPSVTFDGRSFMLDGRRIWLTGGGVDYTRHPREQWADRIHAAKTLGVNVIRTTVVWSRHEPRPGVFDFKGDNDLRHFVQLVGAAGMFCSLRLGPFVGDGYDLGGLPAWLLDNPAIKLRTSSGPFLEACSRYLTAVAEQIRDLQVTSPGKGGPVLMVQNEAGWTCGDDTLAASYLGELIRYQREGGLNVPVLNANNLWQSVEGEIDGWHGSGEMLSMMRQLGVVRADRPKVVVSFDTGPRQVLGKPEPEAAKPWLVQRRLAEILAGGGQFTLDPAVGGSTPGFQAGRDPEHPDAFFSTSTDRGAPVRMTGVPGATYHAVRRVAMFSTRFGRLFSNLEPQYQPVTLDIPEHAPTPGKPARGAGSASKSVVHIRGSQGGVAFVFADEHDPSREASLLMPDGSTLPVFLGQQSVAWCILDVQIGGRASVDYCNLNALAALSRVLICFGPAGSRAVLSVNGSPMETVVPTGKSPTITEHEGLVLVICNEQQADQILVSDDAAYIGASSLTTNGKPIAPAGVKTVTKIAGDGTVSQAAAEHFKSSPTPHAISLSKWTVAPSGDYVDGTSARYASIPGPADLGRLGSPYGYGWYRLALKSASAHRAHVRAPQSGDRLHFFLDGEPLGVLGVGPGAGEEVVIPLKKQQTLVIFAENAGRFSGGANLGEGKGLAGHLIECDELRPGKPKIQSGEPLDALSFRTPLWDIRPGDLTLADRITWTMPHRKKGELLLVIRQAPARALLLVNDKPAAFVDRSGPSSVILTDEQLGRGNAVIQLALLPEGAAAAAVEPEALLKLAPDVGFYEIVAPLTAKAEWAFAKWDAPSPTMYETPKARSTHLPAWWRCSFHMPDTDAPAHLELSGVTKGQVYVNGRHLGRYLVATGEGKQLVAGERLYIPRPLLKPDAENEVLVFDEHGSSPAKARVTFEAESPIVARFVADPPPPPAPALPPPAPPVVKGKGAAKSAKPAAAKATPTKKK